MSSSHRQAMFRNMVTSLLKHDRIKTTDTRAKELRRWADHIITLAKRGDLHARRQALSIVREKEVVHKLFEEAGKRFGKVNGGYTRITKLGRRAGDAARVSIIELIAVEEKAKKIKKTTKPKAKKAAPGAEAAATPAKDAPKEEEALEAAQTSEDQVSEDTTSQEAAVVEAAEESAPQAADAEEPEAGDAVEENPDDTDDKAKE